MAAVAGWCVACGGGGEAGKSLVAPPLRTAERPLLELHTPARPAAALRVGLGSVAIGPPGSAPLRVFGQSAAPAELLRFARVYVPFTAAVDGWSLTFRGWGTQAATPAERRMLAEWARRVAAQTVAPETSFGLVFSWHRGGPPGSCDEVAVYLNGEARARSCSWPSETAGRLHRDALARVHRWFDTLAPFQAVGEESFQIGTAQWRLIFAGRGRRQPAAAESAAVTALGRSLHRELAARRRGDQEPSEPNLLLPPPVVPNGAREAVRVPPPPEPPARLPAQNHFLRRK